MTSNLFPLPTDGDTKCFEDFLIVDSFAGGGGASTGIEMALGRSPDIAINHSADALAMHQVNHPGCLHLSKNIWQVDPIETIGHHEVGLAWFSPDCKHFSKAKGGRPVKRNIRDLAWVVVLWAKRVRPRVIILENVEEFRSWGPVGADGKPCSDRKGETFKKWAGDLRRLGYRLEFRELRACDYGAPTIRKRLFMIARRDGLPIVWPKATHGAPDKPAVIAGKLQPWRTAAEIIDWSLPCPSIFETSAEIMAKYGLRAVRPLADATLRRIAKGVMRYVVQSDRPYIVAFGERTESADGTLRTPFTVAPVVTYAQQGGGNRSATDPLHTVTASPKDQNAVIAPVLVGCGGRAAQTAPKSADQPMSTQTAKADLCVAAVHLNRQFGNSIGSAADEPVGTITAGGAGKAAVVSAFLAQHNTGVVARDAEDPLSTITGRGTQQNVVAAHLLNLKGSDRRDSAADAPGPTITAGGGHAGIVSAFLTKYYGQGVGAGVEEPLHTDSTRDRFGLVTMDIDGTSYAIADIGMRMLTPRERFRAQGFPDEYIIDRRLDGSPINQTVQGACCGNSVCPPLAEAIVKANCGFMAKVRRAA